MKLEAIFENLKAQDHLSDHNCPRKLRGLYWAFPKVAGCKLNSFPGEEVMNCLHSLALIWPHILSEISFSHPPGPLLRYTV